MVWGHVARDAACQYAGSVQQCLQQLLLMDQLDGGLWVGWVCGVGGGYRREGSGVRGKGGGGVAEKGEG